MAVLLVPFVAFIVGWIQGAIVALILNFVFAESNGLDVVIEDKK